MITIPKVGDLWRYGGTLVYVLNLEESKPPYTTAARCRNIEGYDRGQDMVWGWPDTRFKLVAEHLTDLERLLYGVE